MFRDAAQRERAASGRGETRSAEVVRPAAKGTCSARVGRACCASCARKGHADLSDADKRLILVVEHGEEVREALIAQCALRGVAADIRLGCRGCGGGGSDEAIKRVIWRVRDSMLADYMAAF